MSYLVAVSHNIHISNEPIASVASRWFSVKEMACCADSDGFDNVGLLRCSVRQFQAPLRQRYGT